MKRNILLTTLDTLEPESTLRYYSAQNDFGYSYCEALQSTEAFTRYILSRFPMDEIIVIGEEGSSDGGNEGKPVRFRDAGALYSADPRSLSAYDLYRLRIAQYIDELSPEQEAYDALLPEEERTKLIGFIQSFQEKHSKRETKQINRLFDELARNPQLYEKFEEELFAAFPEVSKNSLLTMKWVRNYLYTQLKPSAKMDIIPDNEGISARYFPAEKLGKQEYWINGILDINPDVPDGGDEINLYVALGNNSPVDGTLVLNLLSILFSTPGYNLHLKKIYNISGSSGRLTTVIDDHTAVSLSTDLAAAAYAFLNYSKTDLLVKFWENCGERNERISRLIYSARHVDIGISMCNMQEVQQGIRQLCDLFSDGRPWEDEGVYGVLFGIIAGCIYADYSPLLDNDGTISFIKLIKWTYRHQLYQQCLTLIETFAPEHLVKSGIFYYCDDEQQAPEITKQFALQRLELRPYEYYQMDKIEHYFIKNYDRDGIKCKAEDRSLVYATHRAQSIESKDPEKINGLTACDHIETVRNVLHAYYRLGVVRNKVSHADYKALAEQRLIVPEKDVSYGMHQMLECIEFFIMSYEKAMDEAQGKNPNIVFITPDEVRKAADRIKYESSTVDRRPSSGKKE